MKIKIFISILIIALISGLALSVDPVSAKKKKKGGSTGKISKAQKNEIKKIKEDYTIYEAEKGEVEDCVIEDEHKGFSGEGYVNPKKKADATLEIKVNVKEEKAYKVLVRYSLKKDPRRMDIGINGKTVNKAYAFPSTEANNEYGTVEIEMKLEKGENKILFTTIGDDGPNFDLIGIKK